MNQAQQTGRLGELFIEQALTKAGWLCGNFNVSVTNSKSWDIFAKRGGKTRVIRVKTASKFDATWRLDSEIGHPFNNLINYDSTDWTAVVVNIDTGSPDCYMIPTKELAIYITNTNFPADWGTLHLHFRPCTRDVNYPGQYGLDSLFIQYKNNWDLDCKNECAPA